MKSLSALVTNDGEDVKKLTQGEIKTAPAKGVGRYMRGIEIVDEGWGCKIWERRARARFPPAELPVRRMSGGEIERLFKTWLSRFAAC